jgi:5-deoxy-5-amino-3-dehydroquinate synthase
VIHVPVALADQPYDVLVGPGARHQLAEVVRQVAPEARRAAIVTQQPLVDAGWIDGLAVGLDAEVLVIGQGEDHKSMSSVETLLRQMVGLGLSRRDLVVAVGGGLVSDVAGFAAATYHRGIDYLTVSTTLLGQVDAAIGGKTGVNLPEGKNLAGAFWQPRSVICDTEVLSSLPAAEWACGRGEVAKYAFLGEESPSAAFAALDLEDQVARCVAIKASFVVADEHERTGVRARLNYGHTLAHALEAEGMEHRARFEAGRLAEMRHGEAVAVGLAFAARLAERLGRIDEARVELHDEVLAELDLDASLPGGLDAPALVAAMRRDKKAHQDLSFVLDGPRGVELVEGVDEAEVVATLIEMGAGS